MSHDEYEATNRRLNQRKKSQAISGRSPVIKVVVGANATTFTDPYRARRYYAKQLAAGKCPRVERA